MEERPISERLQDIRQLAREFGGIEAIPEESLLELQYARLSNEEGYVRLIPLEKLSTDGIAAATQELTAEQHIHHESRKAPFGRIELTVTTKASFITANPKAFEKKRDSELDKIWRSMPSGENYGGLDFLPEDSAIHAFSERAQEIQGVTESAGKIYLYDGTLWEPYFGGITYDTQKMLQEEGDVLGDLGAAERMTDVDSEKAWNQLERLKSKLTDEEELEKAFAQGFDSLFVTTDYDYLTLDDLEGLRRELGVNPNEVAHIPVEITEYPEHHYEFGQLAAGVGFHKRLDEVVRVLHENKFPDVAERIAGCSDVSQIKSTLSEALSKNEIATQYKAAEKALMASRKNMQSHEEIEAFNVELHRLRDAKKQDLRILRGAAEYFELPRLFAQYTKARINAAQNALKAEIQGGGAVEVILDGRPDVRLDENPGRISGDCTEDRPLPFGTKLPAHNIKIFKDGTCVGNIYLLKTTTGEYPGNAEQPYPVWHLDAIQFPSYTVDHADFVKKLVVGLSEKAVEQGVTCITVNTRPHKISNYDYISRAVLDYLGADKTATIMYDQMEILEDYDEDSVLAPADTTAVRFPEQMEGYSQFQGADDSQYVLWRNPKHITPGVS